MNYANKKFKIKNDSTHKQFKNFGGSIIEIEGYWSEVHGEEWSKSVDSGNPAAIVYMMRIINNKLPIDNNVLYGKIGSFGHLVHVSELEKEVK